MLEVGVISKAHGLRGEVIVALSTDRTERMDPGTVLETDRGPLTVVRSAPHQHRWRVAFDGVDSREAADELRGLVLRAEPIDDPDVWFIHDLIGGEIVLDDGTTVGTCVAVIENPAYDLLELDSGALVPMPFVTDVDSSGDPTTIVIDPPEGLFDLVE